MVFTTAQDAFILMAHFRSAIRNDDGTWSYSLQSCISQFAEAFPENNYKYDDFVTHRSNIIKRFEERHCICKVKSPGRRSLLTQEVFSDLQERLERSPKITIHKLAKETGLSVGTCHKALKKLRTMHPHKEND